MLQSFHEDTTAEQITQMLPYNYRKTREVLFASFFIQSNTACFGWLRKNDATSTERVTFSKDIQDELTNNKAMVLVNHAKANTRVKMVETGICYLRAGDSKGSLLVENGFQNLSYVLLHTAGEEMSLYKLKTRGHFQIWTRKTLEQYGFHPRNASYYVVLLFDNKKPISIMKKTDLKERKNTYRARLRPLADFI